MNNNFKVGLFGMYGLYNYGCEAIVRGTYELIKQTWPSCKIILYTYYPEEDKKVIKDLDIIVKQVPIKNGKIVRRIINKALRTVSIDKQMPLWDAKSVANDCDMVFSVGGDIYTIPKYIRDSNKETKHSMIVEFGKTILKYKPFVIWGASIGPFGNKKDVRDYYFNHLKDINKIFCREQRTFEYLKENGLTDNVELCSDPAFYVKHTEQNNSNLKSKKLRIGLNLSPLSIREQLGENYLQFQDRIIKIIKDLSNIPNTEVVLVPHVISPLSKKDNDLAFLKNIYDSIPEDYLASVSLLDNAKGFLGTKEFLKTCDVVIAARMHCAVNAISVGVPTIFLTYSQKGIGMANYIYGDSKWAIPLMNIGEELKDKTLDMLANKDDISGQIKKRVNEIKSDESRIVSLFEKLI